MSDINVYRVEDALVSHPKETAQIVGDLGWYCSFEVPGVMLDFGEFRIVVSRLTALTLAQALIEEGRDG